MRTTGREIPIAVTAVGTEPQKACRQTGGNCKAMAPIACKTSRRDRQAWGRHGMRAIDKGPPMTNRGFGYFAFSCLLEAVPDRGQRARGDMDTETPEFVTRDETSAPEGVFATASGAATAAPWRSVARFACRRIIPLEHWVYGRSGNVPGNNAGGSTPWFDNHTTQNGVTKSPMQQYTENYFLRLKEVKRITGLSKSTIYNYGNPKSKHYYAEFPKRKKRGHRSVGWLSDEMFAWIATLD